MPLDASAPARYPAGMNPTKMLFAFLLLTGSVTTTFAIDDGDNFNDNSVDVTKWGADTVFGHGVLTETGQHVEFTVSSGTKFDEVDRPWIRSQFPTTNDWDIILNVNNAASGLPKGAVASIGFYIRSWKDPFDNISAEMYTSMNPGGTARGFYSSLFTDNQYVQSADTLDLGITVGAIRVSFDSTAKVLSLWYDTNPADGYQWTLYASYGINNSGGITAATNWNLTGADRFELVLYGYGTKAPVAAGQIFCDDLATTQGVNFQFAPTQLTASFAGMKQKCKTNCLVKGKLVVTNHTTSPVQPTHFTLYLSADQVFDQSDVLLNSPQTKKLLKPGKSAKLTAIGANQTTMSGMYILAVDQSDTVVASFLVP
jgi:hypothetical protein